MKSKKERWIKIKDYEDHYEVSNFARVRTTERWAKNGVGVRIVKSRILKNRWTNGYAIVGLCKNNKAKNYYVHVLVAKAFVPNPLNLPQVNHIDTNKRNNLPSNLEWTTPKGNTDHAKENGLLPKGSEKINAVLKEHQIPKIRNDKGTYKQIARKFGISVSVVDKVRNRKMWRHVK